MRSLADILEEYQFLDADERYRLLIELGRELRALPTPGPHRPQLYLCAAYL
jgi:cysteine desulfuration protein SufE